MLAVARSICGVFGGLCGSLVMTVASDLIPPQRRAAGLGLVTTSFSAAAAFGVPMGLALANRFNWEAPFWGVAVLSVLLCGLISVNLPTLKEHIHPTARFGFAPILEVIRDSNARRALAFYGMLVFAHFTIIPMLAPYLIGNVHLAENQLFLVYLVGGLLSLFSTPRVGRMADDLGRVRVYAGLVGFAILITLGITHARPMPLFWLVLLGGSFFVFASGRFIPAQAILSLAVPPHRRGAFLSLSCCARDIMAGLTTAVGGWLVVKTPTGEIVGYDRLGWMAVVSGVFSVWLASRVRTVEHSIPVVAVGVTAIEVAEVVDQVKRSNG
jgi:predicted MFS family arabinose efflux permease